jgi:threonine 3-dehydrogenase
VRKSEAALGLWIEEVPTPVPAAGEVLIRVDAAGLCGTDLHIMEWDDWARSRIEPPVTIGHELAGTVVEAGARVREYQPGDFVSAESHITCGTCFQCRTGQAHLCPDTQIIGVDRDGALAEYVALPESVLWRNDRARLAPEIAALQEPFGNAVHATSSQELAGRSICVLGCGPIGLFTVAIARASGAAAVVAVDRLPSRLRMAELMGATAQIQATDDGGVTEAVIAANEGYPLDVVFEMSGSENAIRDAFSIVRHGGRVILFGIPSRPVEIDVAEGLIFKNLSILAVSGRRIFETWYRTRWMLESGVVDLRPLVSEHCNFDGVVDAMARMRKGEAVKVIVWPNGPPPPATTHERAAAARS